jgi:nucleoside-diphosphate kinase
LEAYRSVCPEYERWVVELSSGPAVVLEVRGEAVVDRLREIAGPYDPEIARALRPATLRARFGVNAVKNAVHVTDIDVDGPLESKFFFVVLE